MTKSSVLLLTTLSILMALAYWIFSQGLGGSLFFDDIGNLGTLSQVRSMESAMQFIFSGDAGPSGRPLSLASFALQAVSWPHKPEAFIQVNIFIHLLNGVLVAWFSLLLAKNAGVVGRPTLFISLLTALWLLNPIQVSPVLFVVQRMTLLAGLFTLLGMIFYLIGRAPRLNGKPSWFWIALAFAMTIPATFSKENGALLPGFLLILEFFIFSSNADLTRSNARNKLLIIWTSVIFLFGIFYLYRHWPSFAESFAAKGYTPAQHLATEMRVLVHYLSQILLPNLSELGPFHDDFPISDMEYEPHALAALAGLLVLAGIAWWSRHRCPLFAAGVFIFLWGHAMESTVIPLEPYFEHRNYIPILGVAMALSGLAYSIKTQKKLITAGLAGLLLLHIFSTYQYAAIWGQQYLAAQYWHAERPKSVRAIVYLEDYLTEKQRWAEANQLVSKAWQANPENMGLTMHMLSVICRSATEKLDEKIFNQLVHSMQQGPLLAPSTNILYRVLGWVTSGKCPGFTVENILTIQDVLSKNPHYQTDAVIVSDLMIIQAHALLALGHTMQSAALLSKSIDLNFRILIALQAARLFEETGNHPESVRILKLARDQLPINPWLKNEWLMAIKNTETLVFNLPQNKIHAVE